MIKENIMKFEKIVEDTFKTLNEDLTGNNIKPQPQQAQPQVQGQPGQQVQQPQQQQQQQVQITPEEMLDVAVNMTPEEVKQSGLDKVTDPTQRFKMIHDIAIQKKSGTNQNAQQPQQPQQGQTQQPQTNSVNPQGTSSVTNTPNLNPLKTQQV